jgi:predicted metal-dependent HD superfamily phosphohydrolase
MDYKFSMSYCRFFDLAESGKDVRKTVKRDFERNMSGLLSEAFAVPRPSASAIARSVYCRMADRSLHYHTPVHILAMFQFHAEQILPSHGRLAPQEQLAIWFHDAIYVATAPPVENEEQSAALMMAMLGPFMKAAELQSILNKAKELVLATAYHLEAEPLVPEAEMVLDLDLSSFAFDPDPRAVVSDCIRKEYPHVSDADFAVGRKQFRASLASKGFLFRTPAFKERFELKALEYLNSSAA